jgi:hypothetical protein
MSDLRIALVAEGPTDYVIIEAALKAFLPQPFILTQLQPEATKPEIGGGWGGVLKWCSMASERFQGPIDQDPTLLGFDLLIIHLDVDVSTFNYADCGEHVALLAQQKGWASLPCALVCPPVDSTVQALQAVITSWLGQSSLGGAVLCLPAQSSGTWLAAALLDAAHPLLRNTECDITVESRLAQLPKSQRVKKTRREYMQRAAELTNKWADVKTICSQASQFETAVLSAI